MPPSTEQPSQLPRANSLWPLLGAIALGSGLATPLAFHFSGESGLTAVGVAAICCGLGAIGGRCVNSCFRKRESLIQRVLGGMLVRMGIPLGAALSVQLHGGPLAEAGFVYYVLVFYILTLGVETGLWVRHG